MNAVLDTDKTIIEFYQLVRQQSELLAAPLAPEDTVPQSMPDASPIKWHLAHTTWFFETFILAKQKEYQVFHADFNFLFNSYYNGIGAQYTRAQRGLITRPSLDEVMQYRQYVDQHLLALLDTDLDKELMELVTLGLNHEQQHQELMLTDLKHLLSFNPSHPVYVEKQSKTCDTHSLETVWLAIDAGLYSVGASNKSDFHFDNETPQHKHYLEKFQIASQCVSNGDYLEFMQSGGYENPEYWLSDGWAFVQQEKLIAPLYWQKDKNGLWHQFSLHGLVPIDLDAPVTHISCYEADAYASFMQCRLPTEFEWEVATAKYQKASIKKANFVESQIYHPISESLENNFLGNVWQWTASSYLPYPGFEPWSGTVGEYNGKFMSGQMVLRGGSCATPSSHIRTTYRNFFPPSARWQFSGIRLAK